MEKATWRGDTLIIIATKYENLVFIIIIILIGIGDIVTTG